MEKNKRGRGANYTAEEKTFLAELVTKYKHIIENKRTGGSLINKKKEAWKLVTLTYNRNCTSGVRNTEQLKTLYDNMKQKSRKIVAENNCMKYKPKGHDVYLFFYKMEYMKSMVQDIVTQEKVQMNKTGGGFWKPKSTDCDSKILAVIQDQVDPLSNDSAAAYIKEEDNIYGEDDCTAVASTSSAPVQETNYSYINNIELRPAESMVVQIDEDQGVQKNITKKVMTPSQGRVVKKKQVPKKIKKDNSSEALKRIYFKKKIQNAQMERKKLALEIVYMKEKYKLEMEILKRTINNNYN